MPDALPDDPVAVTQRWKVLIKKFEEYRDLPDGEISDFSDFSEEAISRERLRSPNPEKASYFQEKFLPIFDGNEIAIYITNLETKNPWLLEFKDRDKESFAETTRKLQQDPIDIPDILSAYITLLVYARIKRGMTASLRDLILDEDPSITANSSNFPGDIKTVLLHFEDFLKPREKYIHYKSPYYTNWADLRNSLQRLRQFDVMVLSPHPGARPGYMYEGLEDTIKNLRSKITNLSLGPDLRGKEQFIMIEDLKKKISTQEKEMKKYRSILSDLSYRHLMEMLPLTAKAARETAKQSARAMPPKTTPGAVPAPQEANSNEEFEWLANKDRKKNKGKKSAPKAPQPPPPPTETHQQKGTSTQHQPQKLTPQWQDFWKEAWDKASENTSDLHTLWKNSNDIRRAQIKDEGNRIYGLLSANIHDFAALYDVEDQPQDVIRETILLALKPKNVNIMTGEVDWDLEQKRFL